MAMNRDRICILHLIQRHYRRGAELFASQLSSYLAIRGFHNVLCSLYESNSDNFPIPEAVDSLSIKARQAGLPAKFGLLPLDLLKLVNIFRKLEPEIVLVHGSDSLKYAALASRFYRKPLMIYRNIGMASFWKRNSLQIQLNKKLLERFDAVVSVSKISREDFLKLYGLSPNKVFTIPNGIDLKPYQSLKIGQVRSQIRHRLGITEKDTLLISVGNLSPEKNQSELITLVNELREMSLHLVLLGDGPLRQKLEQQANEYQLQERIHFLGLQSNVAQFLAASDIFLLPSRSEGMPAVLIEAGMAGLPSVAYDVGGVKEVIETDMTGIIVPSHSYQEFKANVVSLLGNPEKRRRLGSLARQQYPKRFAMEKVASEYEALLLKLLKER